MEYLKSLNRVQIKTILKLFKYVKIELLVLIAILETSKLGSNNNNIWEYSTVFK